MRKRLYEILMIALLTLITISCGSGGGSGTEPGEVPSSAGNYVQIRYEGSPSMGYYEVTLNYKGQSDYAMGRYYVQVLKTLSSTDPNRVESRFAQYFKTVLVSQTAYDLMMTRVQQIKTQIPKEYRDFIDGMASQFRGGTTNSMDDELLSVDEVYYFSLTGSVFRTSQCAMIAAYGSASATGKPIIGRLFDWHVPPTMEAHGTIVFINKSDNKKMINIGGSLLDQSVTTGLNQHGIFAALLDSTISTVPGAASAYPDLDSDTYYAYGMDLRYALENYSTIEDIKTYMSTRNYTYNHLIVLGDSNTVKVMENDLTDASHRNLRSSDSALNSGVTWGFTDAIAAVNAFMLQGNTDNYTVNPYNTIRWQSINDQMSTYLPDGNISVDEMKKIATFYDQSILFLNSTDGGIMNASTQQIMVYDAANSSLQMFFRNNRTIGKENETETSTAFDPKNPYFYTIPVSF